EAGIVWATTLLTNIYGGMASLAALSGSLQMNVGQVSALSAMMLFAHNIPTEQSVVHRAGASAWFTGGLRILAGIVYGASIAWACRQWGWMQEPVSLDWMQQDASLTSGTPDVWSWLLSSIGALAMMLVIIV